MSSESSRGEMSGSATGSAYDSATGSANGSATGSATDNFSDTGGSQVEHLQSDFELKDYETQFYGFTPKSFSDGLYNAIIEYMSDYLGPTINTVKMKCGLNLSADDVTEIQSNIQQAVVPSIDKAFDKMEVFLMENVLGIPPHVLLEEDKIHDPHSVSHKDIEKIEQEIKDLQSQIGAKRYVNACLRQELEDSAPVMAELDALMQTQKMVLNESQRATKCSDFEDLLKSTAVQLHELDQGLGEAAENGPLIKRSKMKEEPMEKK